MRTYKEQIKVPNSDTMTPEKENKLKGSISEFLDNLCESSAAKYIQDEFSTVNPYSKQMEKIEKERNEELVKISMLNSGILDKLESIEKSLKKGQDTSVQNIVKPTEKTALQKVKEIHTTKADNSFGLFDLFLSLKFLIFLEFLLIPGDENNIFINQNNKRNNPKTITTGIIFIIFPLYVSGATFN